MIVNVLSSLYERLAAGIFSIYLNIIKARSKRRKILVRNLAEKRYSIKGKPQGNVIMLVIDCLRYRNLSFTGYTRKTSPFLDNFDIKAKAFSASPQTFSSVPSILTGLYPSIHGATIKGSVKSMDNPRNFKPVKESVLLLPELLSVHSYSTFFVTSIFTAFLPFKSIWTRLWSAKALPKQRAELHLEQCINALKKVVRKGGNFFMYIHLGDLHEPLQPPDEYRNFFNTVEHLRDIEKWSYRRLTEQNGEAFEKYKYNRILLYDNTLRYVDESIEAFIKILRSIIPDTTLIVVTADHGEEFWEHAELEAKYFYDPRGFCGVGHGHNLFNEIIEVPVLLTGDDLGRIRKIPLNSKLISTVDITPTILDWLGVEYKDEAFDGTSLYRGVPKDRSILSEAVGYGYEKKAIITNEYKMIYSAGDKVRLIFNIKQDPLEKHPLRNEELANHLERQMKKFIIKNFLKHRVKFGEKRKSLNKNNSLWN